MLWLGTRCVNFEIGTSCFLCATLSRKNNINHFHNHCNFVNVRIYYRSFFSTLKRTGCVLNRGNGNLVIKKKFVVLIQLAIVLSKPTYSVLWHALVIKKKFLVLIRTSYRNYITFLIGLSPVLVIKNEVGILIPIA